MNKHSWNLHAPQKKKWRKNNETVLFDSSNMEITDLTPKVVFIKTSIPIT